MSSHLYVLELDFGFLILPHKSRWEKKTYFETSVGELSLSLMLTSLVKPDGGAFLYSVVTSLAHLEGSATIRDSPNKWKSSKASTTTAMENHPSWQIQWRLPGHSHGALQTHTARAPHEDGLCVPPCFRRLIYYYSHPAPLHALLSICTVVLAVCSNLLLF